MKAKKTLSTILFINAFKRTYCIVYIILQLQHTTQSIHMSCEMTEREAVNVSEY